ncbi:hypothetical protein DESC_700218 [Desulfosarcina cetonica]|nr:hypothetical protein DESC_700218 [Desulfosarcina cetonica]
MSIQRAETIAICNLKTYKNILQLRNVAVCVVFFYTNIFKNVNMNYLNIII